MTQWRQEVVDCKAPWCTFKKNQSPKNFLYFRKWNFLASRLKNFRKRNFLASNCSYISGRNFPSLKNKKNCGDLIYYISQNGTFLPQA